MSSFPRQKPSRLPLDTPLRRAIVPARDSPNSVPLMAFDDEDKKEDAADLAGALQDGAIDALETVAVKDPDDDDGPRDSFIGRWSKFLVIMVFLGGVTAGLAAF